MSGNDWLIVITLIALVVLVLTLDGLRRLDDREAERLDDRASEDRYRRERENLP